MIESPSTKHLIDSMVFRNQFDRTVSESVINLDEYRIGSFFEAKNDVELAVDVGSHVGSFTRLVKHYWPKSRVIAIEPDPSTHPFFFRNTGRFSDIYYHSVAITANNGPNQGKLVFSADGSGAGNFLAEAVAGVLKFDAGRPGLIVNTTSILDILDRHKNPDIDLLKLDCEGPEAIILKDLRDAKYLSRIKRIVGEWHHFPSIPIIKEVLGETHDLELHQHDWPWGAFFASRKIGVGS